MKAEFNKNGVIRISATNEVESYALEKWLKENIPESGVINTGNIVFDFSDTAYNDQPSICINGHNYR